MTERERLRLRGDCGYEETCRQNEDTSVAPCYEWHGMLEEVERRSRRPRREEDRIPGLPSVMVRLSRADYFDARTVNANSPRIA